MAITSTASPTAGLYSGEMVDWTSYHTLVKQMIEQLNASQDIAFVSQYIQDTDMRTLRHFQRSFEWLATSGDTIPQETQRLGGWAMNIPQYTYTTRYQFTENAMANMRQGELDIATADIVRAFERLQCKLAWRVMLNDGSAISTGTDIQVQSGFWNAVVTATGNPPAWKGYTPGSTHTHYNATATSSEFVMTDFNYMMWDITHHGYGTNLSFYTESTGVRELADMAQFTTAMTPTPVTTAISTAGFGDTDTGITISGVKIYREDWIPSSYYAMLSNMAPIVCRRVPMNPGFRGLQFQKDNLSDNPVLGSKYWCQYGHLVAEKGAGTIKYKAASWADPGATTGIMSYGW